MGMSVLPLISTSFIVLSALLVAIGWRFVRRGKIEQHKQVMAVASIFAVLFFISYVSRTVFIGNTAFGGPSDVAVYYHLFLVFHIILSTVAAVLGIFVLYYAFKRDYAKHRKMGPATSIIWFFTAGTGIMVYLLLYVIYPPGETTNMFKAILGG
jgi:putative membrane protein